MLLWHTHTHTHTSGRGLVCLGVCRSHTQSIRQRCLKKARVCVRGCCRDMLRKLMCKKICPRKNDAFICPHFHPRCARLALHSFLSVCYCSALSGSVRLMSANLLPFCPCHVLYFLVMMMIFMQGAACADEASILCISLLYVAPQIKDKAQTWFLNSKLMSLNVLRQRSWSWLQTPPLSPCLSWRISPPANPSCEWSRWAGDAGGHVCTAAKPD